MLFATGVSQARCMCLIPSNGSTLELRDFQVDMANANAGSSISRNSSGKIAFWRERESVAATGARKAEGASVHALLTPSPPIWTGRDVCVHWESVKSTLRILNRPRRKMLSNLDKSGLPADGYVLRIYKRFGIANAFFSRRKASCAWSSERRSTDRSRFMSFAWRPSSTAFPLRIGAPRRVISSLAIRLKSLNMGNWSTSSKLLVMISHLCVLRRRPVCLLLLLQATYYYYYYYYLTHL